MEQQEVDKGYEPHVKMTYAELLDVLCKLKIGLEALEDVVFVNRDNVEIPDTFTVEQILTARMELMDYKNKEAPFKRYTSKRITELSNSLKGFIQFYHEDIEKRLTTKKKSKYD